MTRVTWLYEQVNRSMLLTILLIGRTLYESRVVRMMQVHVHIHRHIKTNAYVRAYCCKGMYVDRRRGPRKRYVWDVVRRKHPRVSMDNKAVYTSTRYIIPVPGNI